MNLLESLIHFHQRYRWWAHSLYWIGALLIAVSSSKYYDGRSVSYNFEFASDALYMLPQMTEAYSLAYFVLPIYFYRKKYIVAATLFLAVSYVCCAMSRIIIVKICEPLAGIKPKAFETFGNILTDIPKLLYVYFFQILAVSFVFLLIKTLKDQLQIRQRTISLEREKAETELKLLKAQLNPHFLFNTLNNIYSLSLIDPARTPESIARLADILDHVLYRSHSNFVPLSEEIELVRNYIELEKLRYDQRLTVELKTAIDRDVLIPPLILLSLVENAFKHGASTDTEAPVIEMNLVVANNRFVFEITNTVDTENTMSRPDPIGLNNLRWQLDHLYGKAYQFNTSRQENRFYVRLIIDIQQEKFSHETTTMLTGR